MFVRRQSILVTSQGDLNLSGPVYDVMAEDVAAMPAASPIKLPRRNRRSALGGNRLGRGLGRIGRCRRRVPAALGRRDIDGVVGLRLRRKGLDRELGCCQRLRVEAFGNIVALAAGVRI